MCVRYYPDACFWFSDAGMPCACSLPAGYDVTQSNLASEYIPLLSVIILLGSNLPSDTVSFKVIVSGLSACAHSPHQ